MRLPGLLMMIVAVPAAAAWLYLIGQSAASIVSLLDEPAAAGDVTPVVATATAATATAASEAPEVAPSTRDEPDGAAPTRAAQVVGVPAPLAAPPAPVVDANDAAGSPNEHPDITDPRIRALLQPAWDD